MPIGARHRRPIPAIHSGWRIGTRRWARHPEGLLIDDADRGRGDVCCNDRLAVCGHIDHVRAVLARAEDKVDLLRCRIVPAKGLRRLCREPYFAVHERQPVRPAKSAEVDRGQCVVRNKVDDRERVVCPEAIVRDIGRLSICGRDDLMGIVADRDLGDNLERGGTDDRKCVVLLR